VLLFGGNHWEGCLVKLLRRQFLHLAAGAAAMPAMSRVTWAQSYPARTVTIIVPFPPGAINDILARLMGHWLSERLGQEFVVENRSGAAGNVGTEAVVRASPDGYTILLVTTANATSATFYDKLSFNFIQDIAPVAGLIRMPNVVEVNPTVPATTIPEFIAYAKSNPGKINFASSGNGGSLHLCGELFKMMAGVNITHVPYLGSVPALNDLVGGKVQVMFDTMPGSIEYIRAGKLRPLAVTTKTRSEALPDIPTVDDFLPGYEASGWNGLGVPKNTPPDIVKILNQEINAALSDPKLKARIAALGAIALIGSPADFGKLIAEETEKWGQVIRTAGIKAE
jgi:tripartite-type tricarboxylate transporter receptor subunit TctC